MTTILHINASAQKSGRSLTRRLGELFLSLWREQEPKVTILGRDVGENPISPIDQDWIAAAFTQPQARTDAMRKRLAVSDALIDEVIAADVIVMGVPMYNYGLPASLKGWIDQVARIGRTFSFDLARGDVPIEPILRGKSLVVLSSRGEFGFAPGGMRAHMNVLDPAIAACAHYFGVAQKDIHSAIIEYQEFKDERHRRSIEQAEVKTREIVDHLLSQVRVPQPEAAV